MPADDNPLGPPPRTVHWRVMLRMLFGQPFTHVMWVLFCASLAPIGATGSGEILARYASWGEVSVVHGEVTEVHRYPAGETDEYGVRFRFSLDGAVHVGETVMGEAVFSVGQVVDIELRGDDPATAIIEGYPDWVDVGLAFFLCLFPLGMGAILCVWIRDGYQKLQLLRYGYWVGRALRSHPDDDTSECSYDHFMYVVATSEDGRLRPANRMVGCAGLWPVIAMVGLWLVF